ncbi:MAG: EsaB/YukD family protein [Ruminococcus sp.]|nr:EsaB/YukD family protein [Ruminococcus sp.]
MNKILIKLFVPAANLFFDILAPADLVIEELIKVLANGVNYMSDGAYAPSGGETLSQREPEVLFDPSFTLADYGVHNGAELIMI